MTLSEFLHTYTMGVIELRETVALLEKGRIIEAIKHVRTVFALSLKEAKDLVDNLRSALPDCGPDPAPKSCTVWSSCGDFAAKYVGVGRGYENSKNYVIVKRSGDPRLLIITEGLVLVE